MAEFGIQVRVLLASGLLCAYGACAGAATCTGVIYPEVREPYRTVIDNIIRGIELGSKLPLQRARVTESVNSLAVPPRAHACEILVALGRSGAAAVRPHFGQRPVIIGAVFAQPGDLVTGPTYSLVPDPEELFLRLKHFMPGAKRVLVVYDPTQNGPLIADAAQAAKNLGLTLHATEVRDPGEAVRAYKGLLATMEASTDALWLVGDAMTHSSIVLPIVIESSWNRKLVVFSNQASHAKNGVLFSVYPDDQRLGRRIASLVNDCATTGCAGLSRVFSLRDLKTAVNVRTAARLNVRVQHPGPYADLLLPAD